MTGGAKGSKNDGAARRQMQTKPKYDSKILATKLTEDQVRVNKGMPTSKQRS
jgi:hypothetical protein